MAKTKAKESKNRRLTAEALRSEADAKSSEGWLSSPAARETIESVIIAFVLAFLFRTFEAEAFVIPTGSMAPTLMGKHKDLECPMCHYRYQVSASDHPPDREHLESEVAANIYHSTCPMCRFTADLTPKNPQHLTYATYEGDRILVAKFPYDFADPKRWDVIVFKFPGNATMNYIKRLVGLPGETIRIHDGDLWIHKTGQPEGHFEIARKPPEKILAMLQPVFDNDLAPVISGKLRWPPRWAAEPGDGGNDWTTKDLATFENDGKAKGPVWIRYRHLTPTPESWQELALAAHKNASQELTREDLVQVPAASVPAADRVPPRLISDFTAYNTGYGDQFKPSAAAEALCERGYGQHWVGDLAVQFELESKSASGAVEADLVKGGHHFQCRFDLASGKADFSIGGAGSEAAGYHRTGKTPVVGPGRHTIRFANVDDELTLWVDEKVVAMRDPAGAAPPAAAADGHPGQYDSARLHDHVPTVEDLSPAGIASDGAAVSIGHIKIFRDIYYIAVFGRDSITNPLQDYVLHTPDLANPLTWSADFQDDNMRTVGITLKAANPADRDKDQFFVLGDNSGQSSDGRLWEGEHWVDRKLLIGKALIIYWPHGWEIPGVPLPFNPIPNFHRMLHVVR